ncbi:Phosphatidyl-N-methylethanolamine N-methyltransferase [Balamuthia mandrillaris]
MEYLDQVTAVVDYTKESFQYAALLIVLAPTIWNLLARLEYHTRFITQLAGGYPTIGCYLLALWIFSFSGYRDMMAGKAMEEQPQLELLDSIAVKGVAGVLFAVGMTFVLSSMYALGITGTYLGDYFGILLDSKVTGFPFSVLNHPMYVGASLCFFASALWYASPAGLVLALLASIAYFAASKFEGPFTRRIYSLRRKELAHYREMQRKKQEKAQLKAKAKKL